jgi:sialic acid synthase SpsE
LRELVASIRTVELARGDGIKRPAHSEAGVAAVARRRLTAAQDLPAGAVMTDTMVALRRAGSGLEPGMLPHVLGRRLRRDLTIGEPLTLDLFD